MLNKIMLQGRLVADPELRHTPSGVAVASFRLAVERDFKDKDTDKRKADFINVVAWRQTGEFAARFFGKGDSMVVEGRLEMRDYEDKQGNKRTVAEVNADHCYFDGSKKDGNAGSYSAPASTGYTQQPSIDQFEDLADDGTPLPF